MKDKDSFILYKSFYEPIKGLSSEQLGKLFRAIFEWQINASNDPVSVDDDIQMAFGFFVNQFRIDNEKYNAKCEQMRDNINRRWNTKEYNCIQKDTNDTKAYKTYKSILNENDNENVNDNDDNTARRSTALSFPFSSTQFIDTWNELRKQPKWRHKTISALQKSLDKLAGFDEQFAIELMDTAIANGNQGLVYPNTQQQFQQWKRNHATNNGIVDKTMDNIWED